MPTLPELTGALANLEDVAEQARAFLRHAQADNTRRAYEADWRHYSHWCARRGVEPLPSNPQLVALYLYEMAEQSTPGSAARTPAATIARRLSGLVWRFRQEGCPLDREDRHLKTMMAAIRRRNFRPPAAKAALLAADLVHMIGQIPQDLRGVRDRALLLVGFAGGLRRGEIVGLDHGPDETPEGTGWVELHPEGLLVHIRAGKTGAREVEIGRGSAPLTCPVEALATWLRLARIEHGPIFRRISRDGRRVLPDRASDRFVARLVQQRALAAGLRGDVPEALRRTLFAGHSLRAGLATSAEAAERHVQRQLGHASAEMTRRYQRRRDRFRINLTKAAGL